MVSKRPAAYRIKSNDDGYLSYAGSEEPCYAWMQVFHDGKIEIVRASYYGKDNQLIDIEYEGELLLAFQRALKIQAALGIRQTIHGTLAILGAAGCRMRRGEGAVVVDSSPVKLTDNDMKMSEFVVTAVGDHEISHLARLMRASFDRVARACGLARSLNYDGEGNWKPPV
jgi:hypothetical protein